MHFSFNVVAAFVCAAASVAFAAPEALADGIDLTAGDRIRLYDSTGDTPGGEFKAIVQQQSGSSWIASSPEVSWQAFCLETDEYFSAGELLRVASVTLFADRGGSDTDSGDKISLETAWLYTQFWDGSLAGLNGAGTGIDSTDDKYLDQHQRNATHLQEAIWYLEGESLGVNNYYVDLAGAAVAAGFDDYGSVRVATLERWKNGAWTYAQDQLVMTKPVPEPGTLALLGLGLLGASAAGRRSRRRSLPPTV